MGEMDGTKTAFAEGVSSAGAVEATAPGDEVRLFKLRSQWNGASVWFFMIAGLTIANWLLWLTSSDTRMVLGLISTRLPIRFLGGLGMLGFVIEAAAVLVAAVGFALLGVLVRKQRIWALLTGVGLVAVDLAIFLVFVGFGSMFDIGLRLFAIATLVGSYRVIRNGGDVPGPSPASKIGSAVAGYLALAAALAVLGGVAWLALEDVAMFQQYGAPTSGSWGLASALYGIGVGICGCLAWIGIRMLRSRKPAAAVE